MVLSPPSGRRRDAMVASLLALAVVTSYVGSFLLKLGLPSGEWAPWFGQGLAVALAVKGLVFVGLRVHRGLWRYAGLGDLVTTVHATVVSSVALAVIALVAPAPPWLLSVVAIDFFLGTLVLAAVRVGPRLVFEVVRHGSEERRVVVIGAGDAGEAVVRELKRAGSRELCPVAFVDDDVSKHGRSIHGVPVDGRIDDVGRVVRDRRAHAILVAICGLSHDRMRQIRALARQTGLPVKRIPAMEELLTGRAGIAELRDFTLEELLEREPVRTDHGEVDRLLRGRTVLVTGAAGSIGGELCRQIVAHEPDTLITLDVNENALFELEHELRALAGPVGVRPVLCNIRDRERLDEVFATHAPQVVFHAAAYKHVPVLEHFPEEAVRTNVLGTRHVAELAAAHGVERFVLISTDKAVRPTSVMGTTKRVAELVVTELQERSATHFTTLRFGNVLGSNGSVMQVFRKQIARGGPVTVTHPEMRRYFMSIPEAVELVLFAAAMDGEGSTYVLDMGEQVRILDLARHFVRLCGLEPGRDIQIEFTGLRPGEKLYEELWTEQEEPQRTEHPGILRAPRGAGRLTELWQRIDTLVDWAHEGHAPQVVEHLRSLVPDYTGDPVCLRERPAAPASRRSTEKSEVAVELSVIEGVSRTGAGGRDAVGVRQR